MTLTHIKKQSKEGASQAGEETRQRLINAGIEVFGIYGYEAATTRMLAKSAGVNLAAIPYHFGGKEGLYIAVVKCVCGKIIESFREEQAKIAETVENEHATREEIFEALDKTIRAFGKTVISSDLGRQAAPIIMREQIRPTKAFDIIYENHLRRVHEHFTNLVARLKGLPPDSEEAVVCAHAIIGQVFSFRMMRELALRRLKWQTLDDENVKGICDVIINNVHGILSNKS